jgi:hypothetical protein
MPNVVHLHVAPAPGVCRTAAEPLVLLAAEPRVRAAVLLGLLVAALAAAAADGDCPEEGRAQGEGEGDPVEGQHFCAHREVDAVGLDDGVEGARQGREEDCGCDGGQEGE